jgi:hypothetical protein
MLAAAAGLGVAGTPAPARAETAYALTTANQLIVFDTAIPTWILDFKPLTGLAPGETMVGIDFRPLNGQLYGIGLTGRLYRINHVTGASVVVGNGPWTPLISTYYGVDFDPVADRLRGIGELLDNVSFDPDTGTQTKDGPVGPGAWQLYEIAYSNNYTGASQTTLYGIDGYSNDKLTKEDPYNSGALVGINTFGFDVEGDMAGFDIGANDDTGWAVMRVGGVQSLYVIHLAGGNASPLAVVGGGFTIRGLALLSRPVPLWSFDPALTRLVRYYSSEPSTLLASVPVTGLQAGEKLVALDFRPATGQLYGVGSTNRLYVVDTTSGAATPIGPGPFQPLLDGSVGMDFDPVADTIRIITSTAQNLRINPDTATVTIDTPLGPATSMVGLAYSNNVAGAATTTAYTTRPSLFGSDFFMLGGLDGDPSPSGGVLTFVGSSGGGVLHEFRIGYDVSGADGVAFGAIETFSLNVITPQNGAARSAGGFPVADMEGLAVEPPGRLQLAATEISVIETGPQAIVTVNRVGGHAGPISIDYTTNGVTANGATDFTSASGTLVFLDGEMSKQIVIPIAQDPDDENDELFLVTLSNPFLGTSILGPATAAVTIVDDDPLGSLPPTVTIVTPTADPAFVSPSSVLSIAGTASDDVGVFQVAWFNDRGGAGIATGTTDWSVPSIPLLPGQNVITVTAIDTNGNASQDTLTVSLNVKSYTFAEGATGEFFDTDLLLGNHYDSDLPVVITYLLDSGMPVVQNLVLPAHSRTTVRVDEVQGMEAASFSTVVDSSSGQPFAVERTQRWDASGYGAHTEKASDGPGLNWYFAEGSQGFFQTYLLLGNPGGTTNEATVKFLMEGGAAVTKVFPIAPRSRLTVYAGDVPELVNQSFGIAVTFSQPGMAERAMYFGARLFEGGHASAGVTAPSTNWFHAEGATGDFFTSFLLLANPGNGDAHVTLTYFLDAGDPIVVEKVVPALSRLTINLATESPALAGAAVATRVVSDVPIVSERAMYWPGAPQSWQEAHDSFGVTASSLTWALAEGRVGGPSSSQTFILLANPGADDANVTITCFRSDGTTVTKPFLVEANSRKNVFVNLDFPELADEAFSSLVTSDHPIVVERALYSDSAGVFWAAGTNATATPIP